MHGLEIALWCCVAWWGLACLNVLLNLLLVPGLEGDPAKGSLPSLSVVIPARDEEAALEASVASHCGQDYPGLQVVVVDDCSTDSTPFILQRLKGRFPNLEVIRGHEPPEGWIGKAHALKLGIERATGEMLLLVDADVRYEAGVHRRAVGEMVRRRLDMLQTLARLEGHGLEPLILSFFHAVALFGAPSYFMNLPRFRKVALGSSTGMFVRRDAFEAAGGMERLRMKVPNDLATGRMMKGFRGRYLCAAAFDCVEVRMYAGLRDCIEGFTKNCYHFYDRHLVQALFIHVGDLAVQTAPLVLLSSSLLVPSLAPLGPPSAIAVGAAVACNTAVCLWAKHPLWLVLAFPLRPVLWFWILVRSVWRYHRQGVVWRGRTYSKVG